MRPESFTVKVQEAIERAQRIARDRGQQALEPAHVVAALLEDENGVARAILEKLGTEPAQVESDVEGLLQALPRVSGAGAGELRGTPALSKLFDDADREREQLKDDYISVEHVLLAATAAGGGLGEALKRRGVTKD